MQSYAELSVRENQYHPIIHVGTNDISTNKKPQQIPKSIVELALPVKSNSCDVTLSETRVITLVITKHLREKESLEGVMQRK